MDAQTLNGITYENTSELIDNPEVILKDADGNYYKIVGHETEGWKAGQPFVLNIERYEP